MIIIYLDTRITCDWVVFHFIFIHVVKWENDKKMTLEFELDKMGSPIPTCTNKG